LDVPFDRARFPIQLSELDLEDADLVIALKKIEHHEMMVEQFPTWADRITYWHINDLDYATADEALPLCETCIKSLIDSLLAEQVAPARLRRAA
jgi:protein-tyrosine phosphatase